jgi:hypothetical protein
MLKSFSNILIFSNDCGNLSIAKIGKGLLGGNLFKSQYDENKLHNQKNKKK